MLNRWLVVLVVGVQSAAFGAAIWEHKTLGVIRRFAPRIVHPVHGAMQVWPARFYSHSKLKKPVRISHPCIDGVFQHGFAEPSILSDFLNAALSLKGNRTIQDIEYLPRDLPSSNPISDMGYHFTVDVRCCTRGGQHFLVEMQNDFRDDYHLKALIEHSRMISRLDLAQKPVNKNRPPETSRGNKRKFWTGIQGIYSVVITNKSFNPNRMKDIDGNEPIMEPFLGNPYELRHVNMTSRRYGDIPHQIVLLMLANLHKKETELSTPIERWAYLFKDKALGSGSVKIPETKEIADPALIAGPDQAISHFIERVKEENIPFEVRDQCLRHIRYYNDCILDIEERGVERGKAEGRKEGEEQATNNFIDAMLDNPKLTDADIAIVSKVPEDQIRLRREKRTR